MDREAAKGTKPGAWARYELLSTVERKGPPVSAMVLTVGPAEKAGGKTYYWWDVEGEKESGERYAIRLLSERVTMVDEDVPAAVKRYIFRGGDDQPIEYVDARNGSALLPKFEFTTGFLPQPMPRARLESGFAVAGMYLGHVLSLAETGDNRDWQGWPDPTVLRLNPDEIHHMYGLARDTEGRYITEGDYTYVPLTREEFDELIDLGMNSFISNNACEQWVFRKPVFFFQRHGEHQKLDYPELFYRSNFRGAVEFIDEPEIHMLADKEDLARIRRPEEGAYLLSKRVEELWTRPSPGQWRRPLLREELQAKGINLGTLALDDADHPIWVTMIETSFYQLAGGAAGVVQEGRYQLKEYEGWLGKFFGREPDLTVREMLLLTFAWLRGAARAFDKSWGISIYGQCDPEIAPQAITLAYDMGARYIWFWSYDHQHHLPHFMKLKLLRHLKEHETKHPRPPLDRLLRAAKTAIVLPYGYGYQMSFEQMWESPNLKMDTMNAAGVTHRAVVAAALKAAIECARSGEDFDFTIDAGQPLTGYERIVRIGLDARASD